jgi:transketolase
MKDTEQVEQSPVPDSTGQSTERKPKATRDAYGEALLDIGKKRLDIVVLDADLSGSTKTGKFAKVFPERFFNLGVRDGSRSFSYGESALCFNLCCF